MLLRRTLILTNPAPLVKNVTLTTFSGFEWPPVMINLATLQLGSLLWDFLLLATEWLSRTMTLVLRLTEFDLCRLDSRGCPLCRLACLLPPWESRDRVTMGTLRLPVTTPTLWSTLEILAVWELVCPSGGGEMSRRQLRTIMFPLPP